MALTRFIHFYFFTEVVCLGMIGRKPKRLETVEIEKTAFLREQRSSGDNTADNVKYQ